MKKKLFNYFVELSGHPVSSAALRTITMSKLSKQLIRPFISTYNINTEESEYPVDHYKTLQDYFTRRLKKGSRPIDDRPGIIVSPVDGCLSAAGELDEDQSFTIKSHRYSIKQIFGDEKRQIPYEGGFFYVFYLSPANYHRFHYPADGTVVSRYALGTVSFPVNDLGLRLGNEPFATNYRLVTEMQTNCGKMAVVKVGALNVNSIHIASSETDAKKGEEFGYFSFGSTVIVFTEKKEGFRPLVAEGEEVKVGEAIGEFA